MSPTLIGAIAGGIFGLVNFILLQSVAKKVEEAPEKTQGANGPKFLRVAAWADLIIFPLIGAYVAPMFF